MTITPLILIIKNTYPMSLTNFVHILFSTINDPNTIFKRGTKIYYKIYPKKLLLFRIHNILQSPFFRQIDQFYIIDIVVVVRIDILRQYHLHMYFITSFMDYFFYVYAIILVLELVSVFLVYLCLYFWCLDYESIVATAAIHYAVPWLTCSVLKYFKPYIFWYFSKWIAKMCLFFNSLYIRL